MLINECWSPLMITDYHWSSVITTDDHWLSLIITDYHWWSLIITDHHWSPVMITDYHWSSLIITDHHWSTSLISVLNMGNSAKSGATSRHLQPGRLSPWESGPEGPEGIQKRLLKKDPNFFAKQFWLRNCHIFHFHHQLRGFQFFLSFFPCWLRKIKCDW